MVVSIRWLSTTSRTRAGSNNGMLTDVAPEAGIPRTPATTAAWNIGAWKRNRRSSGMPISIATWYRLSTSARWVSRAPLGRPVVPLGLRRHHGLTRRQQVLVADHGGIAGRQVAVGPTDDDETIDLRTLFLDGPLYQRAEDRVGEHDPASGILEHVGQLCGAEADVDGIDDARPEQGGVVELDELVPVHGEHGEPVTGTHAQLVPQRRRQAQDPLHVGGEGSLVPHTLAGDVDEPHLVRVPLRPAQQQPRVHQLLHVPPPAP